jgi:hypothetical protein
MFNYEPFDWFRWMLAIVATIYATIVTLQSLWGWYVFLAGSDRYVGLLRRYLVLHGLRLRFKTFWGDVIICTLLCIVFLVLWQAHGRIYRLDKSFQGMAAQRVDEQVLQASLDEQRERLKADGQSHVR